MAAKPYGQLNWDIGEIAKALKIGENDVKQYFTDGRRVSFILERRLACEVMQGRLAPSEGAGYDLLDWQGRKWEVRSITKGGIYFCPSYMVGSGRSFDKAGFLKKLKTIQGFIISDVESFSDIPFWIISSRVVRSWWDDGRLGLNSKVSRRSALELLQAMP